MRKEVDVRKLVRYQPLFQELNDAQIEALMPSIREVRIEKGRDLFHREDPCDGLWLVVYGRVKLFITSPQGKAKAGRKLMAALVPDIEAWLQQPDADDSSGGAAAPDALEVHQQQ